MKKMIRRMLSLTVAVMLLLSVTVGALAASYEASDFAGLETAFADTSGEDVSVNVTGDIDFGGNTLTAQEGIHYTVSSNTGNTMTDASFSGTGSVEINNIDLTGTTGLTATGGVEVTVNNGDVTGLEYGIYADGSTVTVAGDVTGVDKGIYAYDNSTVTVAGDVSGAENGIYAYDNSTVTVSGNVTGENYDGIDAYDSTVTVTGNVTGFCHGIYAYGSTVTVAGNVTGESYDGIYADGSTVTVTGNVTGNDYGIDAYDSTVSVDGNVAGLDGNPDAVDYSDPMGLSDGGTGAYVEDSSLKVTGNVTGGNGYGTYAYGGTALNVNGISNVEVGGNAVGGSVIADPATKAEDGCESIAGDGVDMDDPESIVYIGGNAIGGSTNGNGGYAGDGVNLEVEETDNPAGSLTVVGNAIGGKAENGHPGYGFHVDDDTDELKDGVIPTIKLGGYDSIGAEDLTDAELEELTRITGLPFRKIEISVDSATGTFWGGVIKQIRSAEKGTTLTVDADDRTTMPAGVVEAVKECGVTLIIQWEGGKDITIDANFNKEATNGIYLLADL